MLSARHSAIIRCAKSRQTPARFASTSRAPYVRRRRADDVVDVRLDPRADRLHAAVASGHRLEAPAREREDRLDLAVAAGLHVRQHLARHLRERDFSRGRVHGGRIDLDGREVPDVERSPRHVDAEEPVAPAFVAELVPAGTGRDRHALGLHALRRRRGHGEIEDEQRLREDVVVELAVDVEGRHRCLCVDPPVRQRRVTGRGHSCRRSRPAWRRARTRACRCARRGRCRSRRGARRAPAPKRAGAARGRESRARRWSRR